MISFLGIEELRDFIQESVQEHVKHFDKDDIKVNQLLQFLGSSHRRDITQESYVKLFGLEVVPLHLYMYMDIIEYIKNMFTVHCTVHFTVLYTLL